MEVIKGGAIELTSSVTEHYRKMKHNKSLQIGQQATKNYIVNNMVLQD